MLGREIKERRKMMKISQAHLADLACISVNTLYKIEREQSNPTLETLNKIADTLGLELCFKLKSIDTKKDKI